jgi:hypothetical protein
MSTFSVSVTKVVINLRYKEKLTALREYNRKEARLELRTVYINSHSYNKCVEVIPLHESRLLFVLK